MNHRIRFETPFNLKANSVALDIVSLNLETVGICHNPLCQEIRLGGTRVNPDYNVTGREITGSSYIIRASDGQREIISRNGEWM